MTDGRAIDTRLALILLLIDGLGELRGRTRLQKLVFLTQSEGAREVSENLFDFVPHRYGPFSRQLDAYVVAAKNLALLVEEPYEVETSYGKVSGYRFRLTRRGERELHVIMDQVNTVLADRIRQIVSAFGKMDMKDLLEYVYDRYPNMASPDAE